MFQKIASAILSICLLFSTVTWAEEEKAPFTTYVNGEKIEAKDPIWMDPYDVVPYAATARHLGYIVTYDEAENKVISQKDNTIITLMIGDHIAKIAENSILDERYLGNDICEFDGTIYLSTYAMSRLFNAQVSVLPDRREVHIITFDAVSALVREKTQLLKALTEEKILSENFRSNFVLEADMTGKSEPFGIELNGGSRGNLTLQKQGKSFYASIRLENSGLFNFYNMELNDFSMELNDQPATLVGKPLELECYLNDDGLYVKGGSLTMEIIHQYVDYLYGYEQKIIEKCAELVKDKWIFFPFNEEKKQEFSFLFDGQYTSYQQLAETFTYYIWDNNNYNLFSDYNRQCYQDVLSNVEKMTTFFDSKFLSVTETEGKRTVAYHLDKTMLKPLLNAFGLLPYYQEESFDEAYPFLTFDLRLDAISDKTSQAEQTLLIELSLPNIPNEWGLECGAFQYKIFGRNTIKEGVQDINCPDPSQTVSNEEILNLLNEETDKETK